MGGPKNVWRVPQKDFYILFFTKKRIIPKYSMAPFPSTNPKIMICKK